MPTRESYDRKLKDLYQDLLRMGVMVEDNLKVSRSLLPDKDKALLDKVKGSEKGINEAETLLEDKIISLIATEQPVAGDLRKIVSCLKIVAHLERMGDYAVHVAKALRKLDEETLAPFSANIEAMIDTDISMLDEALTAFISDDSGKAKSAAEKDDEVDGQHDRFRKKLYDESKVTKTSKEFALLLLLGRYLERIGDLVTNICEWIVYSKEGRHAALND